MSPFFILLTILEAIEDGIWPKVPRLFWKAVDLFTGEVFIFYAGVLFLLVIFVAPVSSVLKWVERISKILAPFQVGKLLTWYRSEAWWRLGDFWAVATLVAVFTLILTSLFMTAPHASVFSFLNRWLYGIVFSLTVAEPGLSFLGELYPPLRTNLSRLSRHEMLHDGSRQVRQETTQRLAWIPQLPFAVLELLHRWTRDLLRNAPLSADPISTAHAVQVEQPPSLTAPVYHDIGVQTGEFEMLRTPTLPAHRNDAIEWGRRDVRYRGQSSGQLRQGSYERNRSIHVDDA